MFVVLCKSVEALPLSASVFLADNGIDLQQTWDDWGMIFEHSQFAKVGGQRNVDDLYAYGVCGSGGPLRQSKTFPVAVFGSFKTSTSGCVSKL